MEFTRRRFFGTAAATALASAARAKSQPGGWASAEGLANEIADRRISSIEAVDGAIARIEREDGRINAIVVRDFDRARDAARAADAALARGERKPLLGVPLTVKESYNVAGLPTTWGMPQYARSIAPRDAVAVARLKASGAIVLGKSNLHFQMGLFHGQRVPLLLHDWQSFNPLYGTTNNPWDTSRTAGGSSGGAAAALAMGYVPLELGSDIGGSIRAPAHFCGVYGHKPTSGLVAGEGHEPPGMTGPPPPFEFFDMAVYGPMARTARDLQLSLNVLAARPLDPPRQRTFRDFRIFVLDSHPLMPTSDDVRSSIERRADLLERAGAIITRKSDLLPDLVENARAYMRALSAFDSIAWTTPVLAALASDAAKLDGNDRSLAAERLRGAVLSPPDLADLSRRRRALRVEWIRFFESFDVLLCPIMPTTAFRHDESADQEARRIVIDRTPRPYMDQLFWPGVATLCGLPSTTVPLGVGRVGLPIGAQLIGRWSADCTTIALASMMERAFGGARRLPLNA